MKKENIIIILLVLILIVSLAIGFEIFFKRSSFKVGRENTVMISGQASEYAKPDIVYIDIGVMTKGEALNKVLEENNKKATAVVQAIKSLGVKDEDIQTSGFWIYQDFDYSKGGPPIPVGYNVTNNFKVKVTAGKLSLVVVTASANGANQFGGIMYDISNEAELKEKILSKALEDAKKRAESLLKGTGKKIKDFKTVSVEYTPADFSYYYAEKGGAGGAGYTPPFEPGINKITVTVFVVFEIED